MSFQTHEPAISLWSISRITLTFGRTRRASLRCDQDALVFSLFEFETLKETNDDFAHSRKVLF